MMRALNSITDKPDWEKKVRLLSSLNCASLTLHLGL
jgi:hypothetical protein